LLSTKKPWRHTLVVEWGNSLRNVGLQHEVLPHYG
jgi:hypothetical protein